jgi:hypothetical protein
MARRSSGSDRFYISHGKKRTSIGSSVRSKPKNKNKKKSFKKSRGQGSGRR